MSTWLGFTVSFEYREFRCYDNNSFRFSISLFLNALHKLQFKMLRAAEDIQHEFKTLFRQATVLSYTQTLIH
jgi:hypothetical protein